LARASSNDEAMGESDGTNSELEANKSSAQLPRTGGNGRNRARSVLNSYADDECFGPTDRGQRDRFPAETRRWMTDRLPFVLQRGQEKNEKRWNRTTSNASQLRCFAIPAPD
jgi:hypothetical protein